MYCVKLYRNGAMLDKKFFEDPVTALKQMRLMIMAAALSCDNIPNLDVEFLNVTHTVIKNINRFSKGCAPLSAPYSMITADVIYHPIILHKLNESRGKHNECKCKHEQKGSY